MKNILIILLLFINIGIFAQRSGVPIYIDADTIKGEDTTYIYFPDEDKDFKSLYGLSLNIYFEELGGTSDGTCYWQVANDTGWVNMTTVEGVLMFSPNDTITIENGLNAYMWVYGNLFNRVRCMCIGTTGDTTRQIPNYIRK